MARTNVVKNLDELYLYGVLNPYTGNGLIKGLGMGYMHVNYDNLAVASFTVGETITGASSSATGVVTEVYESGTEGYLKLDHTTGTFEDDEEIEGGTSGATADVDGVPDPHISESTRNAEDSFADADNSVIVRAVRAVAGDGADTVITVAKELHYDGAGANPPDVGETLTGDTSGATGVVVAVNDDGGEGYATLDTVDEDPNPFQENEDINGTVSGAAFCQVGANELQTRTATFVAGDPPDEAKEVTVSGGGLSTTLVTGGAAGNIFEILRGIPTYSTSDYLLYCTAKTHEEGDITTPIRDKGQLQHRKHRADIERRLTLTTLFMNSKAGLQALADQDIILIAERIDDRGGVAVSEYHYFLQARINEENLPDEAGGDEFSSKAIPIRFERSYNLAG